MRAGLVLVVAVAAAAAVLVAPRAHAQAETLYVREITTCSDSGSGSQAVPFCTLQAAADVVEPGQTVDVGQVQQAAVFTRSGTEDAPITVTGGDVTGPAGERPAVITLDDVEHVVLRDLRVLSAKAAVLVDGGSHVTIDRVRAWGSVGDGVRVTDATDVVVSRSVMDVGGRPLHVTGGARVTLTGNIMERYRNLGVLVEATTDAAITGNTIDGACGTSLVITGATTASVQNNIVAAPCSRRAIEVDAAAAPGTTLDYNLVDGWPSYQWAGALYFSAAELYAATGQGAHDSPARPGSTDAEVDSGNADAPGVLDPAYDGPRVDDPRVANTGSGAYTYLDRGAREAQDRFSRSGMSVSVTRAPVGGDVSVTSDVVSAWGSPVDCVIDFGDGATAPSCAAAHAFSAPGTYTVRFRATTPTKLVLARDWQVTVVPSGGAMTPAMTVDSYGAVTGSFTVDLGPDHPWSAKSVRFDHGDGTSWTTNGGLDRVHTYSRPGTYTVTATITDAGGAVATTQATFTTPGSGFVKYGPTRFLDTRTGLGIGGTARKVGANSTVRLAVGGQRGVPADATAVIVNVTATNPSASGFVIAYPDGAPRPTVSTLNYTAGRTVSNPATVALGTGGYLSLANRSGGTVDLITDVLGYYTRRGATDGMNQLWPQRVLDTRTGHGLETGVPALIPAGGTVSPVVTSAPAAGLAPSTATSVLLNVTVMNPATSGFVTAYPAGTTRPTASNVNFVAGETVGKAVTVPVGQDGKVSFYAHARTNLVVTILGYYTPGGGTYFIPVRPERELDTRTTGTPIAARTDTVHPLGDNASLPQLNVAPASVLSNVTVVNARRPGYLVAYAIAGAAESTLNFTTSGAPVSNMALTGTERGTFHNGSDGTIDLIVDVTGYFFGA